MSSYYGVIFPEFWTGRTGRELREQGGKDAQLLALYLATNRHANMIGLYRLQIDDVKHETGLGAKALERGFSAAQATRFATYDAGSCHVWVFQMARFRLGLKAGEALHPEDRRVVAVNKLYHGIEGNPFLGEFFTRNQTTLRLKKQREPQGIAVQYTISSPLQGASKGLPSQYQDQDQRSGTGTTGSGTRDQRSESGKSAADCAAAGPEPENENQNPKAVRALVLDLVRKADPSETFTDLKELAKEACVRAHLAYDAEIVGSALEQALARKAHAR